MEGSVGANGISRNRQVLRNLLIALLGIHVLVLSWMVYTQSGADAESSADMQMSVFLIASVNLIVAGRLMFVRRNRRLRQGMRVLGAAMLGLAFLSFVVIDYHLVAGAHPAIPVVLVVAILISSRRVRGQLEAEGMSTRRED